VPSNEADPGLVGPNSVTWQLHADPAMWLAGIASLFLQSLHPLAAAGVVQNSNFREDPLGRLMRTAKFVAMSTYAPLDEVHARTPDGRSASTGPTCCSGCTAPRWRCSCRSSGGPDSG
jgi:uncharacterized protein (DUF2236 family)